MKRIIIKYEDCEYEKEWRYTLTEKKCIGKKTKYYINFTYPMKLQSITESEYVFEKLEKGDIKELKNKWDSAIKIKYKSKLTDSFNTKFKLFVFYKFLCDADFDNYFDKCIQNIIEDFSKFEITQELANTFSSQYYQKVESEEIEYKDNDHYYKKTVKEITEKLFDYNCNGEREYKKNYVFDMINDKYRSSTKEKQLYEELKKSYFIFAEKEIFPFCDFLKLISKTECEYCGISIEQIEVLGKNGLLNNKRSDTRGYTLEIDRKLPNLEYFSENCCMSCYWCNNAKTDEFSPKEFKPIAKGINQVWNDRLKKIKLDTVEFNENSDLWKINYDIQLLK